MFVDTTINCDLDVTSSGGGTLYLQMPYRGKVTNVAGIVQAAMASTTSVDMTLTAPSQSSGVTLGVLNFANSSSDLAAKVAGVWTANASSGDTMLSAGTPLLLTVGAGDISTSGTLTFRLDLDPYGAG